jgi:biotin-(acetyl-CoA carboxylase) ligase
VHIPGFNSTINDPFGRYSDVRQGFALLNAMSDGLAQFFQRFEQRQVREILCDYNEASRMLQDAVNRNDTSAARVY